MQRERVADDIYVFTSDLYVQVTASAIITTAGVVLFDTLAFPEETLQMKRFLEGRLGKEVIYVINSHFHADHTIGTCFFEGASVISHARCRTLLDQRGRSSLVQAQAASDDMRNVELILPDIVFEAGTMSLHVGGKTLEFWHTPGHSPDTIVCNVKEDRVLLGSDTVMPIPYFVDGDYDDFVNSLQSLQHFSYENIVQGHGEVVLRGEIEEKIQEDLDYLDKLRDAVDQSLVKSTPLESVAIESCGKSRILLNGAAEQLHRQNVLMLAQQRRGVLEQL